MQKITRNSWSTSLTKHCQVAGALVRPKCMTMNLKGPYQVRKTVFYSLPSLILIRLKAALRLNLVKYFDPRI